MNLQNKTLNFSIICEYNPFHNGHLRQIRLIKENNSSCTVTAIMSGNFVQRGEAALYDKYERAEAAIKCGVDLVLELPFPWCASSAEFFASAGVSLADRFGIFDHLCFGSESGDGEMLSRAAANLSDCAFEARVAAESKKGSNESYIRMRNRIYAETYGEDLTSLPNDILGIEYIKALAKYKSAVKPYIIKREGGFSATESRRRIRTSDTENIGELLPEPMLGITRNTGHSDIARISSAIPYRLRNADADELESYADIPTGMGRRLIDAANDSVSIPELYEKAQSKLYTDARIRRMILYSMTGVTLKDLRMMPKYTTVLGFNDTGAKLLSQIRQYRKASEAPETIPEIITKPSAALQQTGDAFRQYELSKRAESLYGLCFELPKRYTDELRRGPYINKKEEK